MPGSKLSLTKKLQKYERVKGKPREKPKEKLTKVFAEKVSLDETSEFQDGDAYKTVETLNVLKKRKFTDISKDGSEQGSDSNYGDSVDEGGVSACQVCNKDLSHMSIQRRQQHVNKCIDKIEDEEQQRKREEKMLESARNAVLNCPMCGKKFKSENARVSHMKKCSRENNVSTEQMLQLIKDQEKERADQLAAGIIPQELRTKVSKTAVPKKRKIKEPKNQFEEDVQIAIAMSTSITEDQQTTGNVAKGKGKGKKKGKDVLEDVCLVTTLTDEDRQKRMEEKINNILCMSNNCMVDSAVTLYDSELKSTHQAADLWDITSRRPDSCNNEEFYVGALIPPIIMNSAAQPDRNLRRLSSIPGRNTSVIERNEDQMGMDMNTASNTSLDEIITVSTQTAVVLAELAVDNTESMEVQEEMKSPTYHTTSNTTSHCDILEASGFCVQMLTLDKCVQDELYTDTLSAYRELVNNREHSDVTITSSTGDTLYAHKLILSVRCPTMLQSMTNSTIKMGFPTDVVLSTLKFIYTGEVSINASAVNELKNLAEKFQLTSLVTACDKLESGDEDKDESKDEIDGDINEHSGHEITELNMKEIWGESDTDDDDDDVGGGGDDDEITEQNKDGIDDDDYQEIMATQRKAFRNNESFKTDQSYDEGNDDMITDSKTEIDTERNVSNIQNEQNSSPIKTRTDGKSRMVSKSATNSVSNNKQEQEQPIVEIDKVKVSQHEPTESVKSSDTDNDAPKPKRFKFARPVKKAKPLDGSVMKFSQAESIILSDSSDEDVDQPVIDNLEDKNADSNDKIVPIADVSDKEPNDSYCANTSVDLFASPSPQKSNHSTLRHSQSLSQKGEILENVYSTPSNSLSKNASPEVSSDKSKHLSDTECIDLSQNEDQMDKTAATGDKTGDGNIVSLDENSGDDLEITGDNFNELGTPSPTFNRSKRNSNSLLRIDSPELDVKTKYLGSACKTLPGCDNSSRAEGKTSSDDFGDTGDVMSMETNDLNEINDEKSDDDIEMARSKDVRDSRYKNNSAANQDISFDDAHSEQSDKVIDISTSEVDKDTSELDGIPSDCQMETSPKVQNESFQSYQADVWEDFDDGGVGFEPSFVSPVPLVSPKPSCSASAQNDVIDLSQNEDDNNIRGEQSDDDLYQDFLQDGDDSFVFKVDDVDNDKPKQETTKIEKAINFKTPTVQKSQVKKKLWTIPSPFTPMPKYQAMQTPDLKKELKNYGVKPVGKKRMIKILEDIYAQTHQYETDSELEDDEDNISDDTDTGRVSPQMLNFEIHTTMPDYQNMSTPDLKKELNTYGVKPAGRKRMIKLLEEIFAQTHKSGASRDVEEDDDDDDDDDDEQDIADDELGASQCSNYSQGSPQHNVMEESCLHMSSSDSDTSGSPQKMVDITKKLFHYFKSNKDLIHKILTYEPLELDVLKADVKTSGIKCSMDKLMDFLDERCIAFTTKNTRKNRVQKKKGRKKKITSSQSTSDT